MVIGGDSDGGGGTQQMTDRRHCGGSHSRQW